MAIGRRARWLSIGVASALALAACEARLALGARCSRNGDCVEPLVCAAGRCRTACSTARDCPLGAICVQAGTTTAVCQLPPSDGDGCVSSADCGLGLSCAATRCTDACVGDPDCVAGARCGPGGGCVECTGDGDCARGLRCGASHTCELGATDGGSIDGSDARPDAPPRAPGDDCDGAATIDLPAAPFDITYRATAGPWTDDSPSCTTMPDGFLRFRPAQRTLVHFGCVAGGPPNGLAPISTCDAAVADCTQAGFHNAHWVVPDASLFAIDRDSPAPDLELCMVGYAMGPQTRLVWVEGGIVDQTVVLDGAGYGGCGSDGPDAIFIVEDGPATLVAEAPGVDLAWQDLDYRVCDPQASGRVVYDHARSGFVRLRLVTYGVSGPVSIHVTGTTPG